MAGSTYLLQFLLLGAIVQSFRYLKSSRDYWSVGGILVFSALALLPGRKETVYDLNLHILLCAGFYCLFFNGIFKQRILPVVTERALLEYTLIAHYVLWVVWPYWPLRMSPGLSLPISFATGLVLLLGLTNWQPARSLKVFLYVWFILLNIGLIALQNSLDLIQKIFDSNLTLGNVAFAFATGMVFFHLMANLSCLFELLPLKGKHQSWKSRMQDLGEHIALLVEKYDPEQIRLCNTFFILLGLILLFLGNLHYNLIDPLYLVNGLLLILSFTRSATEQD